MGRVVQHLYIIRYLPPLLFRSVHMPPIARVTASRHAQMFSLGVCGLGAAGRLTELVHGRAHAVVDRPHRLGAAHAGKVEVLE